MAPAPRNSQAISPSETHEVGRVRLSAYPPHPAPERFIRRLVALDPLYNFLLTFGIALILQDLVKRKYGVQSQPYPRPSALSGSVNLGLFSYPAYQVFVLGVAVVACLAVWYVLSRTRAGVIVRAATERPELTRALGIDVGRWVTPVFGFGVETGFHALRLIGSGYTYKETGARLHISARTVETHVSAVLRKLQLSSRHELSRWAKARNLA